MINNPFDVQTPENLSTDDMADLFVQSDSDYFQVEKAGHTFISGPRGAGKSMYFRFLEPDCQCQQNETTLSASKFYAAYVPVKETDLNLPELFRLQESKHAEIVLNEHSLVLHIATKIFVSLRDRAPLPQDDQVVDAEFQRFCEQSLSNLLLRSGYAGVELSKEAGRKTVATLNLIIETFDQIFGQLNSYTRKLTFEEKIVPYDGPPIWFFRLSYSACERAHGAFVHAKRTAVFAS